MLVIMQTCFDFDAIEGILTPLYQYISVWDCVYFIKYQRSYEVSSGSLTELEESYIGLLTPLRIWCLNVVEKSMKNCRTICNFKLEALIAFSNSYSK